MGLFKKQIKKESLTFKQDGVKYVRCPCGADKAVTIPAGIGEDSRRLYYAMCEGCGDIIRTESGSPDMEEHRAVWNTHMAARQAEEGETNDTLEDETT